MITEGISFEGFFLHNLAEQTRTVLSCSTNQVITVPSVAEDKSHEWQDLYFFFGHETTDWNKKLPCALSVISDYLYPASIHVFFKGYTTNYIILLFSSKL